MYEKWKKRWNISTSLFSINLKESPPTIEAWIDRKKYIAQVGSGCSWSLVTGLVWSPRSHQELNIMTTNDEIIHSHGIGTIMLAINNLNPIRADVLVVDRWLLSFDMLLGMDIIKILGRVSINQSGEAIFNRTDPSAYTAIRIKEPDFSAEFNEQTRLWTVLWKWSGNHPSNEIANRVPEYSMPAKIQQDYQCELWM